MPSTHPLIDQFRVRAELLDMQGSEAGAGDAIGLLIAWMDAVSDRLTEDDLAVLIEVGGILFREGLNRRVNRDEGSV